MIYSFFKIKNWQYVFSKGKCDWGYLHTVHKNNWLELIINNLLCHFMKSWLALKTKKCVLCIKQSLHIILCILSITQPNLCIIKQKWTILSFHTFYVLYRTINVGGGEFVFQNGLVIHINHHLGSWILGLEALATPLDDFSHFLNYSH